MPQKKDLKNTSYKLALGMFILSIRLYTADYFFMEQKLFNSITNILPQNNLINFIVAAVLIIVIVYALFQLLKSPQEPPIQQSMVQLLMILQMVLHSPGVHESLLINDKCSTFKAYAI